MTFSEIANICYQHNIDNNITTQYGDKNPLICCIVFSQENFKQHYSQLDRTYQFRSDNKYFIAGMGGNSIYGDCLGAPDYIRLDWYINEWKIETCYIK